MGGNAGMAGGAAGLHLGEVCSQMQAEDDGCSMCFIAIAACLHACEAHGQARYCKGEERRKYVRWDAPEREEDAVHERAHADVPRKHVVQVHDERPPDLGGDVRAQQREQHAHNVQHHPLRNACHLCMLM